MAKVQKSQPAAQTPVSQTMPAWLERHAEAFRLLNRFVGGDASVKDAMRQAFDAAMSDDEARGNVAGALGKLVVIKGLPETIFVDALDSDYGRFMGGVAAHYRDHARQTGTTPRGFSKTEGQYILEELDAAGAGTQDDDILAFVASHGHSSCPRCPLRSWVNQERRSETRDRVENAVAEATGAKPDPKTELLAALEKARADKAKALEAEDPDALKAAKAEIARIESELAAHDAAAATPATATVETVEVERAAVEEPHTPDAAAPTDDPTDALISEVKASKLGAKVKDTLIDIALRGEVETARKRFEVLRK